MANSVEFLLKLNAGNFKAGIEQAKAGFKGLDQAASGSTNIATARLKALDDAANDLGDSFVAVGNQAKLVGLGFVAVGGAAAIAAVQYAKFAQKVAEINTLLDVSPEKLKELENGIRQTSLEMGTSAEDTAQAVYNIVSAGVGVNDAIGVVKLATEAAVAGVTDVDTAAKVGLAVINAYGKSVKDLGGVYDVLFTTVKDGVTTIPELSASLGEVLPTAASAGVSIETVGAAIATMTKAGIRTPQAVTALNGAIRALAAPAPEAKKKMTELGITWKGLTETLKDIKGLNLSIGALRDIIPDTEASKAVLALTNNFDGLSVSVEKMNNSAGATSQAYGKMKDTPEQAMAKFRAAINELGLQLGQLAVQAQPVLVMITDWIKGFAALPDSVKLSALAVAALGAGVLTTVVAVKNLTAVMRALGAVTALAEVAAGASAVGAAAPAIGATAAATTGLSASVTTLGVSARAALVAFGPLALVIGAISAAMVGFELVLGQANEELDKAIKSAENVGKVATTFDDLKKRFAEAGGAAGTFTKEMQKSKLALMEAAGAGGDIESANAKKIIAAYEERVSKIESLNKDLLGAQTALGDLEVAKKKQDLASMTDAERAYKGEIETLSREELDIKIKNLQTYADKVKQNLDQALNDNKKYVDQIKSLENAKASSSQSTEDKIRDIRRKGMTEAEAQADVQAQINDKLKLSAETLAQAKISGDQAAFDKAKALAGEAEALAGQAGSDEEQISILQRTGEATRNVIQAEIERAKIGEAISANKILSLQDELDNINNLIAKAKEQVTISIDADIAEAQNKINTIQDSLDKLKDKTVTVTVKTVEAKSGGGPVGFARGGRLPGFGGGDRINALLEAGEFVQNKHATAYYGDGLMHAINSRRISKDALMAAMSGIGGGSAINNIATPGIQKFADGGLVGAAGSTNDIITLQVGGQKLDTTNGRKQAISFIDTLLREARS